jgi:hypothetical protein
VNDAVTTRAIDEAVIRSVGHWRGILGAPAFTQVCPECDVSWGSDSGDHCWCCGQPGVVALDVFRRDSYGEAV